METTQTYMLFFAAANLYMLDTVLGTFSPLQFLISIKSLSQIAFIAFCLETTLQTHMLLLLLLLLFSFFSVVLGPFPLQSILYLLRVYFFRCCVSGPSASCILLNFS